MKILAIEKEVPGLTVEDFEGVLRELYFRQDRPEAILMLECADVAEAHQILQALPLVKEGLITFDVIPLAPYPGFARLFAESKNDP